MDEKPDDKAIPAKRVAVEPSELPAGASVEATSTFDAAVRAEDTPGGAAVPGEKRAATPPAKSLSFLQSSTQPGSLGRLGHYQVLEILGQGGFGIVLKAMDEKLERLVAIKVLGPQLAGNATARTRFIREARAAAAVNNKHVVSTYSVHEHPIPYLVMEFIAGETLQDRLNHGGALPTREILRLGAEIAAGLAAAHDTGLIHRDIKPANILIESGLHQHVKIADFGLARAVDDATLTQSGVIAGTPKYMSPEQARGELLDPRSDLFSLGSVLYTMCTGQAPFQAPKMLAVLKRVCENPPKPIRELNPKIPTALAEIIDKLLVKEPEGRFQSAAVVAELLEQLLAELDESALPMAASEEEGTSAPSRARSRRKWAFAALLVLPVLALALTEATGVTHLFRKAPEQAVAEPTAPAPEPAPEVAKQEPIPPPPPPEIAPEPHIKLEVVAPPGPPIEERNLFTRTKAGDWAEYKMISRDGGREILSGTLKLEVIGKSERTVELRAVILTMDRGSGEAKWEMDLNKPFDPKPLLNFPQGNNAKIEKLGNGKETLTISGKDYATSWTQTKAREVPPGLDRELTAKCWMSYDAPLGGLVKLEQIGFRNLGNQRIELNTTLELVASGYRPPPHSARRAAAKGDWKTAAGEYEKIFADQRLEDGEVGFEYATVLLLSGDNAGYRKMCEKMLENSGRWGVRPYHVARTYTLAPDSTKDWSVPAKTADRELAINNHMFWSMTEQGAIAYRAEQYDDSVKHFERSLNVDNRPWREVINWLWLAMAEQRRGNVAEARAWLAKATKLLDQYPNGIVPEEDQATGLHLHNWLESQVLRREAERALPLDVAPPPREK